MPALITCPVLRSGPYLQLTDQMIIAAFSCGHTLLQRWPRCNCAGVTLALWHAFDTSATVCTNSAPISTVSAFSLAGLFSTCSRGTLVVRLQCPSSSQVLAQMCHIVCRCGTHQNGAMATQACRREQLMQESARFIRSMTNDCSDALLAMLVQRAVMGNVLHNTCV